MTGLPGLLGLPGRILRRRPTGDEGTTLMELMIGMVIMTILMTICTTAIVTMFAGTGKTQAVANSAQQLNTAFVRLDDQVRYATSIDQPTPDGLSVAFLRITSTSAGTTRTCLQLRIQTVAGTSQLQLMERSWPVNADGSVSTGTRAVTNQLAGGVSLIDQNGASITPFAVLTPTGATVQQLRLRLVDLDSTGQTPAKSYSEITFSALNSNAAAQAVKNGTYVSACSQTVNS